MLRTVAWVISLLAVSALATLPARAAEPPAFTVRGIAVDAQGKPVAGAVARYFAERRDARDAAASATPAMEATTGADGAFAIDVPRAGGLGRLVLVVAHGGFAPTIVDRVPAVSPRLELGPVRLLPGVKLAGVVRDAAGKPLAGATVSVSLEPEESLRRGGAVATATTGADGAYAIDGLPRADLVAQVGAAAHRLWIEKVDLRAGEPRALDFALAPAPSVAGRVVDGAGKPVGGARVEREGAAFVGCEATTGPDGRFELPAGPMDDRDSLLVRARGLPAGRFAVADAARGDLACAAGPTVRLTLSAGADGAGAAAAIAAIHYDVFTKQGDGWKHVDGVVTAADATIEADSAWRIALPPGDRARVRAVAADGREAAPIDLDFAAPPPQGFAVAAALPAYQPIVGRVIGPSEKPIAGIRVELGRPTEQALLPRVARAAITGEDGAFRFDDVAPGSYSLRAVSDEALSPPQPVAVVADPPAEVTLKAAVAPRVSGTVTVDGKPPALPLPVLALRWQRLGAQGAFAPVACTATDSAGGYELRGVPQGSLAVMPLRPSEPGDGAWHDLQTTIDSLDIREWPHRATILDPTPQTVDVALKYEPRAFVSGTVLVNGAPRQGLRLAISRGAVLGQPAPAFQALVTDARGRYRARLEGGGRFEIVLMENALRTKREFEFEGGKDQQVDVAVEAGAVAGRLELATTTPGPLRVVLEGEATPEELAIRRANPTQLDDTPWSSRAEAAVGADGAYSFADVAVGKYRVAVEDVSRALARVATAPFAVERGATLEVPALAVPKGGTLDLVMKKTPADAERMPFASARVTAADGEPALPRTYVGWFVGATARIEGLPPAKVKVEVFVHDKKWKAAAPVTVQVAPDQGPLAVDIGIEPRT